MLKQKFGQLAIVVELPITALPAYAPKMQQSTAEGPGGGW